MMVQAMPILRCATPAEASTVADTLVAQQGSALFLFFGAEDPKTGDSWCPDCVTADPILRRTIADPALSAPPKAVNTITPAPKNC